MCLIQIIILKKKKKKKRKRKENLETKLNSKCQLKEKRDQQTMNFI